MRCMVLTLSLTIALGGGLAAARADEPDPIALVDYTEPTEDSGEVYDTDGSLLDASPGDDWAMPRQWFDSPNYGTYVQIDALWLARANSVNRKIAVELPGNTQKLNARDASLSDSLDIGQMYTLGYRFDKISAIEATFFGFNDWNNSATAFDPTGNLGLAGTLQLATTDFIFADRMTINYSSSLYNAEVNYKQTIEGMTLLAGFRYFNLNERFDVNSHNPIFNESSDYNVSVVNRLIGLQVGAGYNLQFGRVNLGALAKIGAYANLAHQNTLLQDFGNAIVLRNYRAETSPVSVLGEIQLNASYQLYDWLALRFGYRFIGVNNLALGPNQLDLSNSPTGNKFITAQDYLLLNGVNAGVEIRW